MQTFIINTEAIVLMDKNLSNIADAIDAHITAQLYTLQTTFDDLVTSALSRLKLGIARRQSPGDELS